MSYDLSLNYICSLILGFALRVSGHALLDPRTSFRSLLVCRRLVLQELLDGVRGRDMSALLSSRSLCNQLFPSLDVRELLNVDSSPSCSGHPTPV